MEPVANQALAELRCLAAALRKRHDLTINKVKRPQCSMIQHRALEPHKRNAVHSEKFSCL